MIIKPQIQQQYIEDAVTFLHSRLPASTPRIVLTQGTGQSFFPAGFDLLKTIPYADIPHFQTPTVATHSGNVHFGFINKTAIAILQGRFHYYEGFEPHEIIFPIRVLHQLGCQTLIATNTAGGLNLQFTPGSLMVITDHINNMGFNPLRGPNIDSLGPRFPDMSQIYSKRLTADALQCAKECGTTVHSGIYTGVPGPSLETPAETRFLRNCGADAVGMSTIPEVIAAKHLNMQILGISLIANVNDPDNFIPITIEDVIAQAQKSQQQLEELLSALLARITKR